MKPRASSGKRSLRRVYLWPALIALTSVLGLTSALLGDAAFDVISWLALGTVVCVVGLALAGRQRR